MKLKDVFDFLHAEAQIECFCVVCDTIWYAFPDSNQKVFQCPKCNRHFIFRYHIVEIEEKDLHSAPHGKYKNKIQTISEK